MNVKFLKGLWAAYSALASKDSNTLYFITDTGALYLGDKLIGKDYESAISALNNAGYQNAEQVGALINAALASYYTKGEVDQLLTNLGVAGIDGRLSTVEGKVAAIEGDYLKAADKAELEGKINGKVSSEGYVAYSEAEKSKLAGLENYNDAEVRGLISGNTTEIAAVKVIAEAARTEEEVNGQIDSKIAALDLANTYEAKGAEERAKGYVDSKLEEANLAQYTTEQEVKDIVDAVVSGAVEGDTISGLANLVEYINTHGGEAAEMAGAIDVLEGKVEAIEAKPAMGILSTDISAWNNEIGAKELAGSKATLAEVKEYVEGEQFAKDADLEVVEGKLVGLTGTVKDYVDGEIAKVDAAGVNSEITGIKNRLDTAENDIDAAEGRLDVIERDYAKSADVESVYLKKADETIYNDAELRGRIEGLEGKVDITGKVSEYVAAEVKKTDDKLANYVEKEGYIAYTQAEKDKLAGLNNYNDTEVRGLISGIDGRVSTVEGKLNGVASVSEAIAAALAEAKKYADDNDANTVYDDTAVRGLISGLDSSLTGLTGRVEAIEGKPAMGITSDDISNWNGKTTLAAVKEAYIGDTNVKLSAVVAAVNKLYDGSEGVNNEIKAMDQNVKNIEAALTWGEIK